MISIRLALPLFACSAGLLAGATCESLSELKLANTTITLAQLVAAGAFPPPPGEQALRGAPSYKNLPAFCRVTGVIKPSSDSDIRFEVWLPNENWNGRFQGIGNGGFAGSIIYGEGLANAVANGYAAASTDTGHSQGQFGAQWGLGHPEKVVDFGYRAIHETAEKGKAIVLAFYGSGPKHSYFSSCSNGGRQALMEAQRYPADYDGIIAGAPANYWTRLFSGFIWNTQALSEPGGYIPPAKLKAIESATVTACDSNDGVKDGVLEDPSRCNFDPKVLLCDGAESDSCLTAPQVKALAAIYSGPKNSKGQKLYPGFVPGGETGPYGWTNWINGATPGRSLQTAFGTQFFSNLVFEAPSWDFHTFNFDTDIKIAEDKLGNVMNATDPNLKAFKDRGGKLILFHGWSDAAISGLDSIDYYRSVESKMGVKQTESFVRLFMVPGMQHCAFGPGPNSFGEYSGTKNDGGHDISKALEHWVEDRAAPSKIIATKYKNDLDRTSGVVRTRPLCPYPQIAKYKGSGSTDDAANFVCAKP